MSQSKVKGRGNTKASGVNTASERPRRSMKRNRLYLDSKVWDNANSSLSSSASAIISAPRSSTPISSVPHISLLSPGTNGADQEDVPLKVVTSIFVPPLLKEPEIPKTVGNVKKKKNFIRFRFQIDCTATTDVNVDDLVHFLKTNMKVEGQKGNLSAVTIERRNLNVHILSKVMLQKKYLKLLSKKYLKKNKQFNYRVVSKNKRAYKILLK